MRRCSTTPSPPSGWGILELGVALILMDGRFHVNNWQISGDACSWRIQLWQTDHPLKRAVSGFAFREGHAWSWQRYAALKNVGNVGGFWESSNLKRPPLWIPFSIYPLRGTSRGFGFISYDTFEASDAALAGMNGCGATAALLFLFYRHVINLLIQFNSLWFKPDLLPWSNTTRPQVVRLFGLPSSYHRWCVAEGPPYAWMPFPSTHKQTHACHHIDVQWIHAVHFSVDTCSHLSSIWTSPMTLQECPASEGIQRRQQHPSAEAVLVQSTYQRVICVQEGDERREAGHIFTPERRFLGFTLHKMQRSILKLFIIIESIWFMFEFLSTWCLANCRHGSAAERLIAANRPIKEEKEMLMRQVATSNPKLCLKRILFQTKRIKKE